jgi:TatA/E family protein of Tat protein translocase
MLDIGFQELIIIMVLALLVFGPERLPELGRKLGRAMREFRRASDEFRSTVETNLQLHEESILAHPADLVSEPAPAPADASSASPGVDGAEAPISGAEAPATIQAPASEPDEPFWTRRGGRLLHRTACAWRVRVPEAERVPLKTAADGWDMGLEACPACNPRESGASA